MHTRKHTHVGIPILISTVHSINIMTNVAEREPTLIQAQDQTGYLGALRMITLLAKMLHNNYKMSLLVISKGLKSW